MIHDHPTRVGKLVSTSAPLAEIESRQSQALDRKQAASALRAARNAADDDRDELTGRALAMLPDSRAALRLRVRSLLADGDLEHAHALIARGLLIRPNDGALMQYRAMTLDGLGRTDEALQEIRRLLHIRPARVGALVLGARIASASAQHERAVMWLTRAHICRPMCERIRQQLAEALVRSDQPETALEVINTLPRPLPLVRARALRALGRLRDAAEVLHTALEGAAREAEGAAAESQTNTETLDELLTESLIIAELRGDIGEIKRRSTMVRASSPRGLPLARLQAARIELSRGGFRRAIRLAAPLIRDRTHGRGALAVITAAAAILQRNGLATRALRRMRTRFDSADPSEMHECWRRAMLGHIINDQRNPRRSCADPASSLLQPLLKQAATTLNGRLRRSRAAEATQELEELRRQYELCRNALTLRSNGRESWNVDEQEE